MPEPSQIQDLGVKLDPNTKQISADKLDTSTLQHLIQAAYKSGHTTILIDFQDNQIKDFKTGEIETIHDTVDKTIERLFGLKIFRELDTSIIIKYERAGSFTSVPPVMKEIVSTLRTLSENVLVLSRSNKEVLKATQEKHNLITKYVSFCLRMINLESKKGKYNPAVYHALSSIDKITDFLKYLSRSLEEDEEVSDIYDITERINEGINLYIEHIKTHDPENIVQFSNLRRQLRKEIKALDAKHSNILASSLIGILDLLLDLFENSHIS
jgi:hypothetical protein